MRYKLHTHWGSRQTQLIPSANGGFLPIKIVQPTNQRDKNGVIHMLRYLIVALVLAAEQPAQGVSGNELREYCTGKDNQACFGFILGTLDYNDLLQALSPPEGMRLCVPTGVTVGQLRDVVNKYMGQHPENAHHAATMTVINAVTTAWPCATPKAK
jgi:hypothetical protein